MQFVKNNFLIIPIILFGFLLRIILIQNAPPALNIDEAALGYNAYSILVTGRDEHGVFLPLALESFGDWKLPGYVYVSIIPISLLGLNEFSVRFPSIIAGTLGILLIYLIAQKLFQKKSISLFSAFFFAVSPWSIYFSRAAYEVNLATTFFLFSFLLFISSISKNKKDKYKLCISGIFMGLSLFTYHSYIIFSILFSLVLIIFYVRKLRVRILYFVIPFAFFVLLSVVINYNTGTVKLSTTTVFNDANILHERVDKFRKDTMYQNIHFLDIVHTRYIGIPYQIAQNYLSSFSPKFLFDSGGEKLVHNTVGFGNLYLFDILLIASGIGALFYKRDKNISLLGLWLIIGPIPSSLTIDSQNSTRLFVLMPAFVLIMAYGASALWLYLLQVRYGKIILSALVIFFVLNFYLFLNLYFIHQQYHRSSFWRVGYKEIVEAANMHPDKKIVMQGLYDFPYIYFLFYNSYSPYSFQNHSKYYPTTKDGFKYVKEFGRYRFVHALADEKEIPGVLYIDNQNFKSSDRLITLPNGDPIFKYYEKNK